MTRHSVPQPLVDWTSNMLRERKLMVKTTTESNLVWENMITLKRTEHDKQSHTRLGPEAPGHTRPRDSQWIDRAVLGMSTKVHARITLYQEIFEKLNHQGYCWFICDIMRNLEE
ncbi:hypothetical protein KM043_017581 [Ampulex compressa]|nr:hypothetical protein KM043_017581 [Ampulex compressa]